MNVKYDLVVDFARPNKSNTVIISEGDSESRVCVFTLLADKQPMDMSYVSTATVRGVREDGSVIIGEAVILEDESGDKINQVAYTIPASVAAINGKVIMTITLMSTLGATITSFEFYLNVRNQLYNENDYVNDQDMTGFRDLLNRTLTALHTMEQMTKQTALPNPYPLRFTHDGVLYTYTGEVETDIVLGNIAFIDTEDYTEPGEAVDETAARIAVEAADRAEEASESAQDASETAVSASESASESAASVSEIEQHCLGYVGEAQGYAQIAHDSAVEAADWANNVEQMAINDYAVLYTSLNEGFDVVDTESLKWRDSKAFDSQPDRINTVSLDIDNPIVSPGFVSITFPGIMADGATAAFYNDTDLIFSVNGYQYKGQTMFTANVSDARLAMADGVIDKIVVTEDRSDEQTGSSYNLVMEFVYTPQGIINVSLDIDGLNNVEISNLQTNDVIKWDGSKFVNGAGGGGGSTDRWIGPEYSDASHQVAFSGLDASKGYMLFAEDTVADYSNLTKSGTTLTFTVVNDVVGVTEFYLRELN